MTRSGRRVRAADVVRRARGRRFDVTTLLAVLLPLLTIGALALVRPHETPTSVATPSLTRLARALVVCPAAVDPGGRQPAVVSTDSGGRGRVSVSSGSSPRQVRVATGRPTSVPAGDPVTVRGSDALAPGLVAARVAARPVSALDCPNPAADQWFAGLGSRADHDSVIELVNPDSGPAVADVTLLGNRQFSTRRLHGVTVPAHRTVRLDLGRLVPRRSVLSAHVVVTRGRLGVQVLDQVDDLRTRTTHRELVPRQLVPAADNLMLGLPRGRGSRALVIGNPGSGVVRAEIKVVTRDTSFAPAGLDPVSVPPGATTTLPLTQTLDKALRDGALGLEVAADSPVVTSLVTTVDGDQAFSVPSRSFTRQATTLLPAGTKRDRVAARLLLAADRAGSAVVTAYDADGKRALKKRYGVQRGHTLAVALPRGTAFVRVKPERATLRGAVLVEGRGAAVIPLHELLLKGFVPQISPGLD